MELFAAGRASRGPVPAVDPVYGVELRKIIRERKVTNLRRGSGLKAFGRWRGLKEIGRRIIMGEM